MSKSKIAKLMSSGAILLHIASTGAVAQNKNVCRIVSPATDVIIAKMIAGSGPVWQAASDQCDDPFREWFFESPDGDFREALGPDDPFMDPNTQMSKQMSSCSSIELPISKVAANMLKESKAFKENLGSTLESAKITRSSKGYDRCRSGQSITNVEAKSLSQLYRVALKGGKVAQMDFSDTKGFKGK